MFKQVKKKKKQVQRLSGRWNLQGKGGQGGRGAEARDEQKGTGYTVTFRALDFIADAIRAEASGEVVEGEREVAFLF